jgi:hypothetical protein
MAIMIPPIDVDANSVVGISAQPKNGLESMIDPGAGIRLKTTSGNIDYVRTARDAIYVGTEADKNFTVIEEGPRDLLDLVNLLMLPVADSLDPEQAITVCLAILEAARWKATDDLVHDKVNLITFLINALRDPESFIQGVKSPDINKDVDVEVTEVETDDERDDGIDVDT